MSNNTLAISALGLHKTFRTGLRRTRSQALQGLDLTVEAGRVFGFLGPNGAGKTTTIKILMDLIRSDTGEARLFGKSSRDVRARARVAYLPELPDFYDYLSASEFLFHCGRLSRLDRKFLVKHIPEILLKVGLTPGDKRELRKYSKGMQQRVGIAQTLLASPDLFILDEPMTGLDPLGRRFVKDLILELGQAGKTVFFSSHILAEVEAVCDQVAFVYKGRVITSGSVASVLDTHTGTWEIVLEGEAARNDPSLVGLVAKIAPSGLDTLLELPDKQRPEGLLPSLLAKGYRISALSQRRASLEEAFILAVTREDTRRPNA